MDEKKSNVTDIGAAKRHPTKSKPAPVKGKTLLQSMLREVDRFIFLPEESALAMVLWTIHTYALEASAVAPILSFESPTKRCGKSTAMELLHELVFQPLIASDISKARLAQDAASHTLLIDEADLSVDGNKGMRQMLNAGWRQGGRYRRVGRDDLVFGAKAIAGIAERKDSTIRDRSIRIILHPAPRRAKLEPFNLGGADYSDLRANIGSFVEENMEALKVSAKTLTIPKQLQVNRRAVDNWIPLLAIAELCGEGDKARKAAVKLSTRAHVDEAEIVEELIRALGQAFATKKSTRKGQRLTNYEFVNFLREEDEIWANVTKEKAAYLLRRHFGVHTKQFKINRKKCRGYELDDELRGVLALYQ